MGGVFGGGGSNPSDAAKKYLDQIPGTITPYYQPYINAGQGAMGDLQSQYRQLLSDPTAIMNAIGGKYQASPGYQWNVNQATDAANKVSQAGGMAGTPMEQQQLASTVSGLANQDYQQFMNQGLGLYGQGLGVAGDINKMGYGASNELAQSLAAALQGEASNAYEGANYENQHSGGLFGSLLGAAGSIFGGPIGGAIGNGISSLFGGGGGGYGGGGYSGGGYGGYGQGSGGMSWQDLNNYLPSSDFYG
jgi:hypothetical protein